MSTIFHKNVDVITFILLTLIVLIQIPLIIPFFHNGFFPTHDGIQTIRVFEYYQSLRFGEFPPRWVSGLLYGYGYPLFVFYNPLVYLAGSIFVYTGFSFLTATKIVFILGFVIGAVGMFLLLKELVDNLSSFVGSVIYSLAPYRALNVYVRGDLAEFISFSLFPFIFWTNLKFLKSKNDLWGYIYSIFVALLVLTHNISAFIYLIFIICFNFFYLFVYVTKNDRIEKTRKFILNVFLSMLISCFYWLPLLVELNYVQISRVTTFSYMDYFLNLRQIWHSNWGYGGFLQESPMSLQLGKIIISFSLFAIFLNILIKTIYRKFIYFLGITFVFTIFLETQYSRFIWDRVPAIHYLQFPWRLHLLITFCGVLLCGFSIYLLGKAKLFQKNLGGFFLLIIATLVIVLSFKESLHFFKEKYFFEDKPVAETTTGEEYLPKWVTNKPDKYPADKIIYKDKKVIIENLVWGYHKISFMAISDKSSTIKIAHIYYPGWKAYVGGNKVEIRYENIQGLMEIALPSGKNQIEFVFSRTWWRILSDLMSVAGIIIITVLIINNLILKKLHSILLLNDKK